MQKGAPGDVMCAHMPRPKYLLGSVCPMLDCVMDIVWQGIVFVSICSDLPNIHNHLRVLLLFLCDFYFFLNMYIHVCVYMCV